MKNIYRIGALLWADVLLEYTFFLMQNYLTDVWKISFTHAASILNMWGGIYRILPVFFLFLADTVFGNFTTLLLSGIISSVGIILVTVPTLPVLFGNSASTSVCKLNEARCVGDIEKVIFYMGMALLAVGKAARVATAYIFAREQEDENNDHPGNWFISIFLIAFAVAPSIGFLAFPYIKKWFVLFGVSAICMVLATLFYLSGWSTYKYVEPRGSPVTDLCRVFVAAAFKIFQPFPEDHKQLYVKDEKEFESLSSTRFLRWLEKAAIISPEVSIEDQAKKRWRLCSVAEVEAAKIAVRMLPMCATFIMCAVVPPIGNTYFVEQAAHMNSQIGKLKVPPQVLLMIFTLTKMLYNNRAAHLVSSLKRMMHLAIAEAMLFSVLCCMTAALVERRRLKVIRSHDLLDKPNDTIPMGAYWLLFQFGLLGIMQSLFENSVAAFFEDESPESMRKYLDCFSNGVSGFGFMCSVLSIYVVGKASESGGKPNWFQYTLNRSHLDRYYWVLTALSSVSLCLFVVAALCYRYKHKTTLDDTEGSHRSSTDGLVSDASPVEKGDPLGFIWRDLLNRFSKVTCVAYIIRVVKRLQLLFSVG